MRDASSLVSIAANQFTPTVNGWVEWSAPASNVGIHQSRLYNVTDSTVAGTGTVERCSGAGDTSTRSFGGAAVVGGKAYRVEHQCVTTQAAGFGLAGSYDAEVYTRVNFWRTA
ncbi:hypothetical protein [Mesorhizobium sp.]|uniref:hypothetical protein n=1 Tax=Mesorhizobium sp. TaxID=1871066 RepID=UPI0011FAF1C1|nr:hypothetical protein [Mesorhizobium sp.]TIP43994.1 MAG: hypothetical protein E5X62_17180 [Mesorhizobium sp.]TIQ82577.1 MAG: hypothetical protein E5X64_36045 [Mesorhizobium sp.]